MGAFIDGFQLVISKVGINDIFDILIVAFIMYKLFCFIRDSRAQLVFKSILVFLAAWFVAWIFKLQMVSYIVDLIVRNAGIALVVVFQPEIRNALERVGLSRLSVRDLIWRDDDSVMRSETLNTISNVVECARVLQQQCMGALVVFERKVSLSNIISTGTAVDIAPNVKVLANIFYNKAPLHDGAVIIRDNRICAASCILPLTQRTAVDPDMGTRHRAAIGMSENSDAVIVVVSEETGRISVMHDSTIKSFFDPTELSSVLISIMLPPEDEQPHDTPSFLQRITRPFSKLFSRAKASVEEDSNE